MVLEEEEEEDLDWLRFRFFLLTVEGRFFWAVSKAKQVVEQKAKRRKHKKRSLKEELEEREKEEKRSIFICLIRVGELVGSDRIGSTVVWLCSQVGCDCREEKRLLTLLCISFSFSFSFLFSLLLSTLFLSPLLSTLLSPSLY